MIYIKEEELNDKKIQTTYLYCLWLRIFGIYSTELRIFIEKGWD